MFSIYVSLFLPLYRVMQRAIDHFMAPRRPTTVVAIAAGTSRVSTLHDLWQRATRVDYTMFDFKDAERVVMQKETILTFCNRYVGCRFLSDRQVDVTDFRRKYPTTVTTTTVAPRRGCRESTVYHRQLELTGRSCIKCQQYHRIAEFEKSMF